MASNRRKDIQGILNQPDLRRGMMVSALQAIQAREGVDTSREQAEQAYDAVTSSRLRQGLRCFGRTR